MPSAPKITAFSRGLCAVPCRCRPPAQSSMLPACSACRRLCPGCARKHDISLKTQSGPTPSPVQDLKPIQPPQIQLKPGITQMRGRRGMCSRGCARSFEVGILLEQAQDAVQEAVGCQNKLHGLQAHAVALGWQVHCGGAQPRGDAVPFLQLQRAVQQRRQLRQGKAARSRVLTVMRIFICEHCAAIDQRHKVCSHAIRFFELQRAMQQRRQLRQGVVAQADTHVQLSYSLQQDLVQ